MLTAHEVKRKVWCTHILALVVLTALLSAYYGWTHYFYTTTQIQPKIINIAGQQRMLSQRIAFLEHLLVTNSDPTQSLSLKDELARRARKFKNNHEILVGRIPLNNEYTPLSEALKTHYFAGLMALDGIAKRYSEKALSLAAQDIDNTEAARAITLREATDILERLDYAVRLFEVQLSDQLRLNQKMTFLLWLAVVGLSILAMLWLFRPLQKLVFVHFEEANKARQDASEQRHHADEVNLLQTELLTKLSYEFRSPLSAIIGALELMPNMRTKQDMLIKRASLACYRMLSIIENMIDNIEIHEQLPPKPPEGFDLVQLLDDTLSRFFFFCREKKLEYEVYLESSLPQYVLGNRVKLSKAFSQVLDNAAKFTPEGMIAVYVRLSVTQGQFLLTLRVVDSGPGIEEDKLDRIFERFYQIQSGLRHPFPGSGVGLYSARKYMQDMGGDITVSSTPGAGSEFILQVPLKPVPKEGTDPKPVVGRFVVVDNQEISRLHLVNLIKGQGYHVDVFSSGAELLANHENIPTYHGVITDYYMPGINGAELANYLHAMLGEKMPPIMLISSTPEIANIVANSRISAWQIFVKPLDHCRFNDALKHLAQRSTTTEKLTTNAKILVVEDDPVSAEIISDMLTNLGYTVALARTGETAIQMTTNQTFDIVLLDLNLPDISGVEVAQVLQEKRCAATIIAITASNYSEDREATRRAGVRYYLLKPVAYQELKNTLKLALLVLR